MGQTQRMSSPLLAEPIPHPFFSSCCVLHPRVGSQVSSQERQGSPSAAWGSFPQGPEHRELAWLEVPLSSELGWDLFLGVWTEPRHRPPRPRAGSTKAETLVLGIALGSMRDLCTWLLGSGKRSILLTRVEWKEVAQSSGSALKAPASLPLPPIFALIPREGRAGSRGGSLELLAPPAHSSVRRSVGASVAVSGLWRVLRRPRAARAAVHRCLRSACWSRRERSSMRTFLS